jgi:hypothetical protein
LTFILVDEACICYFYYYIIDFTLFFFFFFFKRKTAYEIWNFVTGFEACSSPI